MRALSELAFRLGAGHIEDGVAYVRHRVELPVRFERESIDGLLAALDRAATACARRRGVEGSRSLPTAFLPRLDRQGPLFQAMDAALARVPGIANTCLYRSLARFAVYRRRGVPVRFVMGLKARGSGVVPVRPDGQGDDAIEGHAWLELDGHPLGESDVSSFVKTFEYPRETHGAG